MLPQSPNFKEKVRKNMYTSTPIFHQGLTAQEMLDYCKQSTMESTRQPAIETDSTGKEYVVDYGISIFFRHSLRYHRTR